MYKIRYLKSIIKTFYGNGIFTLATYFLRTLEFGYMEMRIFYSTENIYDYFSQRIYSYSDCSKIASNFILKLLFSCIKTSHHSFYPPLFYHSFQTLVYYL